MIEMGKKYQTRDGRAVRILCTDWHGAGALPIVGLITEDDRGETLETWTVEGRVSVTGLDALSDLVPVPTKHEGWMQWGSCVECTPAVLTKEDDAGIIPLSVFLKRLPKDVHEIRLTWES